MYSILKLGRRFKMWTVTLSLFIFTPVNYRRVWFMLTLHYWLHRIITMYLQLPPADMAYFQWYISGSKLALLPLRLPPCPSRPFPERQSGSPPASEWPHEEEASLCWQGAGEHHAGEGIQGARAHRVQPVCLRIPFPPWQRGARCWVQLLQGGLFFIIGTRGPWNVTQGPVWVPARVLGLVFRVRCVQWCNQRGADLLQCQCGHHLPPVPALAPLRHVAPGRQQPGWCAPLPAVSPQCHSGAEPKAWGRLGPQDDGIQWKPLSWAGVPICRLQARGVPGSPRSQWDSGRPCGGPDRSWSKQQGTLCLLAAQEGLQAGVY